VFLCTSIQECPKLKLSSHGRKVHNLGRPVPAIEDMVVGIGLSPLIACSIDTGDRGLISSFIERWHRETSSFHLSMGEVSITLDDVASLPHLPIVGAFHDFQPLHTDEAMVLLVELLMVSIEVAMAETGQCTPTLAVRRIPTQMSDANTEQLPLALILYIFWVTLFLLIRVQPMFMSHTYRPCVTSLLLSGIHGELLASSICTINLMMPVSAPADSLLVTSPCYR